MMVNDSLNDGKPVIDTREWLIDNRNGARSLECLTCRRIRWSDTPRFNQLIHMSQINQSGGDFNGFNQLVDHSRQWWFSGEHGV